MTDRIEKYPKSYLSKQQKAILKNVCDRWIINPDPTLKSKTVSWDIARLFNQNGNRIKKNVNKEEVLSASQNVSMNRSLKTLRERDLIEPVSLIGKGFIGLSKEGKNWCEIHVNGFKEKRIVIQEAWIEEIE